MAAARRLSLADRRAVLNPETGILAEVLRGPARLASRKPNLPDDVDQLESLQDCESAVAIPLNTPQGRGVLVFGHPRSAFFDDERAAVLQAVGLQLEVVLRTALRCRDLTAEKERLTDLEEEARKRMARDLHDGPTQVMASIAMRANYARRLMQRDRKAAAEELEQLEEMARQTTKDIRQMLFTLRPLILESHGLVAALAQLADKMHDTHGVNVVVEAAPEAAEGIDPALQGVAFYVAEEALNNARKHAAAAHIWIRLDRRGNVLILEVRDDGVGFNVGAVDATYAQRGSLGMVNMRERTELVGGSLRVESAEGRGTLVTLTLPVRAGAAAERCGQGGLHTSLNGVVPVTSRSAASSNHPGSHHCPQNFIAAPGCMPYNRHPGDAGERSGLWSTSCSFALAVWTRSPVAERARDAAWNGSAAGPVIRTTRADGRWLTLPAACGRGHPCGGCVRRWAP